MCASPLILEYLPEAIIILIILGMIIALINWIEEKRNPKKVIPDTLEKIILEKKNEKSSKNSIKEEQNNV